MATCPQYLEAAMRHAKYEKMEGGEWFASIPNFAGLWATGPTVEAARADLLEALDGWIEVSVKTGNRVPDLDGVRVYDDLGRVGDD